MSRVARVRTAGDVSQKETLPTDSCTVINVERLVLQGEVALPRARLGTSSCPREASQLIKKITSLTCASLTLA